MYLTPGQLSILLRGPFLSYSCVICQAWSLDGGLSWTRPNKTSLPNPNSKVATLVLSNGEIVLAYNAHRKSSGYPKDSRALLFLATSSTRGRTWTDLAHLEMGMAEGIRYHYPALLQVPSSPSASHPATSMDLARSEVV